MRRRPISLRVGELQDKPQDSVAVPVDDAEEYPGGHLADLVADPPCHEGRTAVVKDDRRVGVEPARVAIDVRRDGRCAQRSHSVAQPPGGRVEGLALPCEQADESGRYWGQRRVRGEDDGTVSAAGGYPVRRRPAEKLIKLRTGGAQQPVDCHGYTCHGSRSSCEMPRATGEWPGRWVRRSGSSPPGGLGPLCRTHRGSSTRADPAG